MSVKLVISSLPVLFFVGGALLWWLASPQKPKLSEAGKLLFFAGSLALALYGGR